MTLTPEKVAHLLDLRAKSLPNSSYKLATSTYGLDVGIQTTLECDEKEMSVVIPFADGSQRDGVGDLLEVGGIRLDRHRKNPLCLFDHGKSVSLPIGMALERDQQGKYDINKYTVILDQAAQRATLKAYLYQGKGLAGLDKQRDYDHSVFTEQVFDMACKGLLRGGSIGYQVIHAKELYPDYETGVPKGLHLLSVLMLEGSLVVLPANQDTVAKMLGCRECCGKPLSPYLIKSLTPYAPVKKAQLGYEAKGLLPGVETQRYHNIPPVTWKPGLGALKALKMKYGKQAMRPEEAKYRSLEAGGAVKSYEPRPGESLDVVPQGGKWVVRDVHGGTVREFPTRQEAVRYCRGRKCPYTVHEENTKSLIPGDLSFWREEQREAEHLKKIKSLRAKYKGFGQTPSSSSLRDYSVGDMVYARGVLTTLEGGKTVPFARTGDKLEITGREGPQWMVTNPRGQYAYVGSSEIRKSLDSDTKSLPLGEIRRKYRAAKGLRRRLKCSSPGTSTLRIREKDLEKCQGMAEARGLKFTHLGGGKVKLIGDDAGVDEVAKHFAVRGL